jgi:ArsR family transcriptional regulator
MPKAERSIPLLAQMFRLLGDQTRLRILVELQGGEVNVSELCRRLKAAQPTVSRHLGILRKGGLVRNRRNGKEIYYSLSEFGAYHYDRSLKSLLDHASAMRIGPIILGLTKT